MILETRLMLSSPILASNLGCEHIVHTLIHLVPDWTHSAAAFEVACSIIPACFMIGSGSMLMLETRLMLQFTHSGQKPRL